MKNGATLVYNVGRTYLLDNLHSAFVADQVRIVDGAMAKKAYDQLVNLETELRDGHTIFKCPAGQHDDLAMSLAMLAWAAAHPHLPFWHRPVERSQQPQRYRSKQYGWGAFVGVSRQ